MLRNSFKQQLETHREAVETRLFDKNPVGNRLTCDVQQYSEKIGFEWNSDQIIKIGSPTYIFPSTPTESEIAGIRSEEYFEEFAEGFEHFRGHPFTNFQCLIRNSELMVPSQNVKKTSLTSDSKPKIEILPEIEPQTIDEDSASVSSGSEGEGYDYHNEDAQCFNSGFSFMLKPIQTSR